MTHHHSHHHHLAPNVRAEMNHAAYWISRTPKPDHVLFSDVTLCNKRIAEQSGSITNIPSEPETFGGSEVKALVAQYALPENEQRFFENGTAFTVAAYEKIKHNVNLEKIPSTVKAAFGVVVSRTVVRAFPTWEVNAISPTSVSFDRFQETEADAFTPVCGLHLSADEQWIFAKTPLYSGWIPLRDIAWVKSRESLEPLVHPKQFLVVTGSTVLSKNKRTFLMGTQVPFLGRNPNGSYRVQTPERDATGMLALAETEFSPTCDVHENFLAFTTRNLFQQIFKMRGEPYSWGGRNTGRDCTRLILDTMRTFGIFMPRNSGVQRLVGKELLSKKQHIPENATHSEAIAALPPGTFLYSDGHAMTYLGTEHGHHYIIHAFSGYQHISSTRGAPLFGTHVTDLSIIRGGINAVESARDLSNTPHAECRS
jgi:cell wall-associated NlpC family hydrolase